jgi:hypothetical protein
MRLRRDHFASVIDERHFTGHQPLRPAEMSLTAFSAHSRCSASPKVYSLAGGLHIPRATGLALWTRRHRPCRIARTDQVGNVEGPMTTDGPRSAAAPETSTRPTIEGRAIKRAALRVMVLSFCRRPRSIPAPRYSAWGAVWLGAEQFRPQHVRSKEGDPPTQPTSGTSIISAEPGHCRAGISLRRLWLLHPVERRKGRPGAHGAAWWSAAEVLVLPAPRSRRGPDALLGGRQRGYHPRR